MRAICLSVVLLVCPATAAAQSGGSIDLGFFRPAMDSRGMLSVNASQVLGPGELSFGLVSAWGTGLLRFAGAGATYEVQHVLTPTLIAAVGMRPGGLELELGGALPFGVMSGDRGPDWDGGTVDDPNDDRNWRFSGQGLGDASLHAKLRLRNTSHGRTGLAVMASFGLPTATADSWLGDRQLVPGGALIVDRDIGRLSLALNAGVRYRAEERRFRDDAGTMGMPMTGGEVAVGTTLPFGGAAAWSIAPQKIQLVGEIIGELPVGGQNWFPLEALAGVKVYLARNSFLSLAGGTGLLRSQGGNPDARAVLGIVFEPNVGDRDQDGLKDDVDRCPDRPEDKDEFQDPDGCPELDNDEDRILDVDDLCPNDPEDVDSFRDGDGCPEIDNDNDRILDRDDDCRGRDGQKREQTAETWNNHHDDDGCPDRNEATIIGGGLIVLKPIHFQFDSNVIKPISYPTLDAVAETMNLNPDVARFEVQGHTDEQGSDAYNLDLSQRRAESVVRYLRGKGVDVTRLVPQGYGERNPKIVRHDPAAWAVNRRVEFLILERASDQR